jgi:hypothetical protein
MLVNSKNILKTGIVTAHDFVDLIEKEYVIGLRLFYLSISHVFAPITNDHLCRYESVASHEKCNCQLYCSTIAFIKLVIEWLRIIIKTSFCCWSEPPPKFKMPRDILLILASALLVLLLIEDYGTDAASIRLSQPDYQMDRSLMLNVKVIIRLFIL